MKKKDFFDRKKGPLPNRRHEFRETKPQPFLIITEGKKTEPIYFEGLAKYINTKYMNNKTIKKPKIRVHGQGQSTTSLVESAHAIVSYSYPLYQQCWIVFDKDENADFDEAIALAEKYGYRVAWSNEAFECWLYLHFKYNSSPWTRDEYVRKLDGLFKSTGFCGDGYSKNCDAIASLSITQEKLKMAVDNASRLEEENKHRKGTPSKCNPCTTVHHLILQLKPYIEELL